MKKYILILLSAIASLNTGRTQVTIGSLDPPANFSALQLEGTDGGLRLPQVPQANRNAINTSSSEAPGLTLYNTNTNWVDYWDGLKWSPTPGELTARNGLRTDGTAVKLGGSLIKNTTINLSGKPLNFIANPGTFRVNTDVLQISGSNVTMQTSQFMVNTNQFSVIGNNIIALPTTGNPFTITASAANKVTVNNQNVRLDGQLRYVDGQEAADHVLVASASGVAHWKTLLPNSRIVEGTLISSNTSINSGSTSLGTPVNITATNLVLTPGKWMIFANFATTAGSGSRRYVWLYLYSVASGGTETLVTMSGVPPSLTSPYKAYPGLTYLVDVTTTTTFRLRCGTLNTATFSASSDNIFKAIAIVESE